MKHWLYFGLSTMLCPTLVVAEEPRTLPPVSLEANQAAGELSKEFIQSIPSPEKASQIRDFLLNEEENYEEIIATMPKYDLELPKVQVGVAEVVQKSRFDEDFQGSNMVKMDQVPTPLLKQPAELPEVADVPALSKSTSLSKPPVEREEDPVQTITADEDKLFEIPDTPSENTVASSPQPTPLVPEAMDPAQTTSEMVIRPTSTPKPEHELATISPQSKPEEVSAASPEMKEAPSSQEEQDTSKPKPKIIKIRTAKRTDFVPANALPEKLSPTNPSGTVRPWTKDKEAVVASLRPDSFLVPPDLVKSKEKRVQIIQPKKDSATKVAGKPKVTGNLKAIQQPSVGMAQLTSRVTNRAPVDELTQARSDMGILTYFSAIKYMKGQRVIHRWELNGRKLFDKPFTIGGNHWRVWSSVKLKKGITGMATVKTITPEGKVIQQDQVRIY